MFRQFSDCCGGSHSLTGSFEVSCQGEFLEDGSVLEIDCTVPAGSQTINSVEYSLNLVSQGIGKYLQTV